MRCAACGARDTGWRPTLKNGERVCPACAQGVRRQDAAEELERRKALLRRLEAAEPFPGIERLIGDARCGVERIERRIK